MNSLLTANPKLTTLTPKGTEPPFFSRGGQIKMEQGGWAGRNQNLGRSHKPKVALTLTHATTSKALLHMPATHATTYKQASAKHAREAIPLITH